MTNHGETTIIHASLAELEAEMMKSDESREIKASLMDADISDQQALFLLNKFEKNSHKNSNQIIDAIIDRESAGHSNLYSEYRYDKLGLVKRTTLNKYDIDKQRRRIVELYRKVQQKSDLAKDFEDGLYFKYVHLNE